MDYIITGLNCEDYKVSAAAVRCLHSLSRSVQQLRTTFHDHAVWKPLMKVGIPICTCKLPSTDKLSGNVIMWIVIHFVWPSQFTS